jgi:hypothetical protein
MPSAAKAPETVIVKATRAAPIVRMSYSSMRQAFSYGDS